MFAAAKNAIIPEHPTGRKCWHADAAAGCGCSQAGIEDTACLPEVPCTPTFPWLGPLGMVPLPSKWLIEFSPPIPTAHLQDQADDPLVVFNLADQVRETIQQTLYQMLANRRNMFLG